MGCSSSTPVHSPQRPVANVQPQPIHQQHSAYPPQQGYGAPQHQQAPYHPHQQQCFAPPQQQQQVPPPPQPNQQQSEAPPTDTKPKSQEIRKEDIEKYVALDKKIREAEAKNSVKKLNDLKKTLADVEATEKQLLEHYNKCLAETAKEKADVDNLKQPNVKSFFKDPALYESKMSQEQEEYLEALNKQEVAQKEYVGVKEQREQLTAEVTALQKEADSIHQLYNEQDELLSQFFNGEYGSADENRLEAELDMLLDRKQRILVAKQKWQNGRLLIHHACNQIAFGVQRWGWLPRISPGNMQLRYQVATEARNNFIAASQNITNAQRYLYTINFPYLKADEVDTLNKATRHIYVDMQSSERYAHATECYTITHRRCAALLQWFDQVIDKTILSDLEKASREAAEKQKALRAERLRLLQEKYTESSGEVMTLPEPEGDLQTVEDDAADTGMLMSLTEADAVSVAGDLPKGEGETEKTDGKANQNLTTDEPTRQPTPLPLSDLAPPPSDNEIFGNIESLRKQHEKEMQEFDKAQEMNKARMEQGLQEKLRARRSRRERRAGLEE